MTLSPILLWGLLLVIAPGLPWLERTRHALSMIETWGSHFLACVAVGPIVFLVFFAIKRRPITLRLSLRLGLSRLPSLLLLTMLQILLFVGLAVPGVMVLLVVDGVFDPTLARWLGTLLVLLPLGWLYASLYVAAPLLVIEGIGPVRALSRSWILTQGNRLRLFGVVLVIFAAQVASGFASLGLVHLSQGASGEPERLWLALAAANEAFFMIVFLFVKAVAQTLAAVSLKRIKEGVDVAELVGVFD